MLRIKFKYFIAILAILIIVMCVWIFFKNSNHINNVDETTLNTIADSNTQLSANATQTYIDMEQLKATNLPTIINFGSDSCGFCREMMREIRNLKKEMDGEANIILIDIDENPELKEEYLVETFPMQIYINSDGTPYIPQEQEITELFLQIVKDENDQHIFTRHIGVLPSEIMKSIVQNMQVQ